VLSIGTKPQEKVVPNAYLVDDDMFAHGPYYNVRAGRKQISGNFRETKCGRGFAVSIRYFQVQQRL
jgi:hypothetical protein